MSRNDIRNISQSVYQRLLNLSPEMIEYPTLLDAPAPVLRAYPRYTMVAEKLETLVRFG